MKIKLLLLTAVFGGIIQSFSQTVNLLKEINPGVNFSAPNFEKPAIVYKGNLLFAADDGEHGMELWTSDGTEEGTNLLADIYVGPKSSNCQNFYPVKDLVLFTAADSLNGLELWRTDGTPEGTQLVKNIYPGAESSINDFFEGDKHYFVFNDFLYFSADDGTNGAELWRSDGTEEGTIMVANINTFFGLDGDSFPEEFAEHNGFLFFSADDDESGEELWRTDSAGLSPIQVKDITFGVFASGPTNLVSCNGYLLFIAVDDGFSNRELWRSDGTNEGTRKVRDIKPGGGGLSTSPNTNEKRLQKINDVVYFSADDGQNGIELWRSDGTFSGTYMVKDASEDPDGYAPQNFAIIDNILYYKYNDGQVGIELWRSDGTAEGTYIVKDIRQGFFPSFSLPTFITAHQNQLFFNARSSGTPNTGEELWRSDGTEEGTQIVEDINPGSEASRPGHFISKGDTLFFTAYTRANGREWWYTVSGTPLSFSYTTNSPLDCNGDTDGQIILQPGGGQPPYTVDWERFGNEGDSLMFLPAGNYFATITDANGASIEVNNIFIEEPEEIEVAAEVLPTMENVNGGQITLSVSGGVPPYRYAWNTSGSDTLLQLSNLGAGDYSVTVTDKNDCTLEATFTVDIVSSVLDLVGKNDLFIFPNPTHSNLILDNPTAQKIDRLRIYDSQGRQILEKKIRDNPKQIELKDPSVFKHSGVVWLQIFLENQQVISKKVLIKR